MSVDGELVGYLDFLMFHDTLYGHLMKKLYPDVPLHDAVALKLLLRPGKLSVGKHEVLVSKPGFLAQKATFNYPITSPEKTVLLFVQAKPEKGGS